MVVSPLRGAWAKRCRDQTWISRETFSGWFRFGDDGLLNMIARKTINNLTRISVDAKVDVKNGKHSILRLAVRILVVTLGFA